MPFSVRVRSSHWGVPYKWAVFHKQEYMGEFHTKDEADAFAEYYNDLYAELVVAGV
jgi:hypothetical protein